MPTVGSGRIQSGSGTVSFPGTSAPSSGSLTGFNVQTPSTGINLFDSLTQVGSNVTLFLRSLSAGPGILLNLVNGVLTISVASGSLPPGPTGPMGATATPRWEMAINNNSLPFTSAQKVAQVVLADAVTLPVSLTGSQAYCAFPPTGTVTITIARNGTTIGSLVFASGLTAGTFTFGSAVTFAVGDVFTITAPVSADPTFGGLSITLVGTRPVD